ncbi:restriction endonuclease subunit S [Flavobacterium sp. N1736]|uniref:restriction endonuclease subunit S n=1 Tax=Flavobacterium sp. N1736 TaxID=2986823 RepID=UPI0022244D75|nr:restriction endonuclease subunit S [Flavobacterium sp. N1736]
MIEVNNIPEGWEETTLNDITLVNPRESLSKGAIAINVPMDCIDSFSKKIKRYNSKKFGGGTKFRNGDTLLARITPCLENGKTAFVDILNENEIGFGSTEYLVFREIKDKSDKHFIYYLSISPRFREIAIKAMNGTSGRQRVQTDMLVNHKFNLPKYLEQKSIGCILSAFDNKIELLQAQNKTLEATAQTIFTEWFGKDSINTVLPDGWSVGKLSDIADFLNGLALQKYPPIDGQESLPVIKIKELKQGITSNTDRANKTLDKKYIIKNGDVLFSWSGSLEVVIWQHDIGALNQHLFKVTSQKYPKWFYYHWLLFHLNEFKSIAATKATTMGHINRNHLDLAEVIIPNNETLKKLNNLFSPLLDKLEINNTQIQTLNKTRNKLLPRLMSGEIRLHEFKV